MQPRAEGANPEEESSGRASFGGVRSRPYAVAPSVHAGANAIRPYPTTDRGRRAGGHVGLSLPPSVHVGRMPFAPTDR